MSHPTPFTMQTQSGRAWSLDDPRPGDVHWPDVAAALAKLCRFGGHVEAGFYSVAQHCCVVCDALPADLRLYGLLHDAHEAYLGDWIRPLKRLIGVEASEDDAQALQWLFDEHDKAIALAAGLEWPASDITRERLKEADVRALVTERRDLLATELQPIAWPLAAPFPYRIKPWPWTKAEDEWLTRLEQYGGYVRGQEG